MNFVDKAALLTSSFLVWSCSLYSYSTWPHTKVFKTVSESSTSVVMREDVVTTHECLEIVDMLFEMSCFG